MLRIKGFATPEGTGCFRSRFLKQLDPGAFRQKSGLWFSSIGIGSYLGDPDGPTDENYTESLKEAVRSGVNVIDSAINYRCQRSERSFGKALAELCRDGEIRREEVIVCTKGGFLPFDGHYPQDPAAYFQKTYLDTGILCPEDVVQNCHAMTPRYLQSQLEKSLENLGLETIDIYYVHNPETQLEEVGRNQFLDRIRSAFEFLEEKVKEGKIRMYGTATWNGFRAKASDTGYLSLQEFLVLAREVAGPHHHFRAVQLPVNLAMPEAWIFPNQSFGGNQVSFLNLAAKSDLAVMGSAALLQARLTGHLPEFLDKYFENLTSSSQKALQFARSVPGLTTALVGMKKIGHVCENLKVAKCPPVAEEKLVLMFSEAK